MKKLLSIIFAIILLALCLPVLAEDAREIPVLTEGLSYSDSANWAYFAEGEDKPADLFFICPTVDTRSYSNSLDLNDKLKSRFVSAIDAELGVYKDVCRVYSPYYRQMSINAYTFDDEDFKLAGDSAFVDIAASFRYYLDNENNGRPIILAGFSQGAEMCIRLLKEFFGDTAEGRELRSRLVAVYAIGWRITDEDIAAFPQIVPAKAEDDLGCVICYDCEDGNVKGSIIIPEGVKTHSINPLNWRTDSTEADASLNLGAVFNAGDEPIPGFCGAYIDASRGSLIIPGISTEEYPKVLDVFADGCFHIYDVMFFHENLRANVALRTERWLGRTVGSPAAAPRVTPTDIPFIIGACALIVLGAVICAPRLKKRK